MHVLLAHVYLFHRPWPPIHRHCYTPAEASHKDTPTQRGHHRQHWAIPAAIYTWNNKIQCNLLLSLHSTLVQDSSAISWNWFRCKEERIFTSCHGLCWLCASAVWPHAELIMIMLTLRPFSIESGRTHSQYFVHNISASAFSAICKFFQVLCSTSIHVLDNHEPLQHCI